MSTDSTSPRGRGLASCARNPRLTAYRKLMKQGNSLVIAPPPSFLKALGLLRGNWVLIEHAPGANYFYVKSGERQTSRRAPSTPAQLRLEDAP